MNYCLRIAPFITILAGLGLGLAVQGAEKSITIPVKPKADSPTAGIQEAIDALGPAGGVIRLQASEYALRQSVKIPSNVTIQGRGPETILRKGKQAGSKLVAPAENQDRSVRVESGAGLAIGDEIGIFDQTTVGWEHSHAICEANGRNGIALWDGAGNTVKNNVCLNNSQSAPGRYSGIWLAATSASVISGNRCIDNQPAKTQKHGIEELANCQANTVIDNEATRNAAGSFSLLGKEGPQSGNRDHDQLR